MTTSDITTVPLTAIEETRLADLENVVEAGLDTFVKVGSALAEIRDAKLYRQTHSSFAGYLADRWQMSESRGYQLISAAEVSTMVEEADLPSPTSERQTRPLSGLNAPEVQQAWQNACATSAGRPTGRDVQQARDKLAPAAAPARPNPKRRPLPDDYRRAISDLDRVTRRLDELHRDDRFQSNRAGMTNFLPLLTEIAGRVNDAAAQLAGVEQATLDGVEPDHHEQPQISRPGTSRYRGNARQDFLITTNGNTARVPDSRALREVLELVGVPSHRDPKSSFYRCFHADQVADIAAALEADGHSVQIEVTG